MFVGSLVAIVSPFNEDGIDILAFKALINHQIESGTDGIVVCGTTGEGSLISEEERKTLIETALSTVNKRVPVIIGCTASSTSMALKYTKEAEKMGADGALIMTPYCVKPTQKGIYQHYKTIHDVTNIPIIIYNHPGRAGVDISVETLIELFKLPRIASLKDSNTDMSRPKALAPHLEGTKKTLLSGDDETVIDYLKSGGKGCISVSVNVAPLECANIMDAWHKGDHTLAEDLNTKIMPLHLAMASETNPQPVKYALYKMGKINPIIKLPLVMTEGENAKIIEDVFANFGDMNP